MKTPQAKFPPLIAIYGIRIWAEAYTTECVSVNPFASNDFSVAARTTEPVPLRLLKA